jgi:hypothetical protein
VSSTGVEEVTAKRTELRTPVSWLRERLSTTRHHPEQDRVLQRHSGEGLWTNADRIITAAFGREKVFEWERTHDAFDRTA